LQSKHYDGGSYDGCPTRTHAVNFHEVQAMTTKAVSCYLILMQEPRGQPQFTSRLCLRSFQLVPGLSAALTGSRVGRSATDLPVEADAVVMQTFIRCCTMLRCICDTKQNSALPRGESKAIAGLASHPTVTCRCLPYTSSHIHTNMRGGPLGQR
jgi:hypothetical protein